MPPSCAYLSNPYHKCTQACSQSQNANHRPHHKKASGYGRSVTDVQVGKKRNDEKRTYSGCPKASNPYHHCDDNCYKKLSDSGATPPVKFDRKKKLGSKPEPPVLDSVPPSKVGAIYLSDASSPISQYSEKNKVQPKNDEQVPSEIISEEIHHVSNVKQPVSQNGQVENLAIPVQTNHEDKIASNKVVPVTNVDDLTPSVGGSTYSSLSGFPRGDEERAEEETESVTSETRIHVGKYHIKESFASILHNILDKYGDIGASCSLESVAIRSYYVECVCYVVQELQSESLMQLSESKLNELMAILKDVESQLHVAWLRSLLDEIAENFQIINQHQHVETEKTNSAQEVELLREKLETELAALAQKEQEVADIKTRIPAIRERLNELELKSSDLNKTMQSMKSQVHNLQVKSLIDELL